MKKFFLLFVTLSLCYFVTPAQAVFDPLAVPNNRVGVHILDPQEIHQAAKLVNSSGGSWGYVTIPIRSNDRDREKWIRFFDNAKKEKLIPIIRLATYPEGPAWVKPTPFDLVDFANFLSDMPWPTKNRYIILFNEPNHANEWGGEVSPGEYATMILDANRIFKDRSVDYFLLSAGLDMSAPNSKTSMDAFEFYRQMNVYQPEWLAYLDGLSVHAYPNPGFKASPYTTNRYGILSYQYELNYLRTNKPIFITETGTLRESGFWIPAFEVWKSSNIVAITPFILMAGSGDFAGFSLLDPGGQPKTAYWEIERVPKIAGSPLLANPVIIESLASFKSGETSSAPLNIWQRIKDLFTPKVVISKLRVRDSEIWVEIADTESKREQGLSGRDKLDSDSGMLFIFDRPDKYSFWMKDMKINLDFVWIRDGKIVYLSRNISNPTTLYPPYDVNKVLEVNAGFIDANKIEVGDKIEVWQTTK